MADINKTVVPADAFSTVDHDEYAAAEAQAKESVGNYTLKLKRPFTYEGQTFDELNFDFEGLTGDDALAIEDELQAIGKPTISPTFSGQFLVRMAARACTNTIIDASGPAVSATTPCAPCPSSSSTASEARPALFCWHRSCNRRRRRLAPQAMSYDGEKQSDPRFLLAVAAPAVPVQVDQSQQPACEGGAGATQE